MQAREFYIVLHALIWGIYYSFLVREFVPMEKKSRFLCYSVVAVVAFLAEYLNYKLPAEGTLLICMNEAKSFVTESIIIIMIFLVCTENPWKGYANVVEANLFYIFFQIAFNGFRTAMYHYDDALANSNAFSDWLPTGKMLLIAVLTVLTERLLRRCRLFGRIPYQLWDGFVGISLIVALSDAVLYFIGLQGFEKNSVHVVIGAAAVLPFFLASAALFYKLRQNSIQQTRQMEVELAMQLKYYRNLCDKQLEVREFRHDLLNYLETLRYMGNENEKTKQYQQQMLEKIERNRICQ